MSTVRQPQQTFTEEEYLELERRAEHRSEFYQGRMYAMAGANRRHNLIAGNVYTSLRSQLRPLGCEVYIADMKVRVKATGLYTYPDVVAACGDIRFDGPRNEVLLNPCILVEVLSKSTQTRDRGWKFQNYWEIPPLVDYVLVSQDQPLIEHYVRRSDGNWMFEFVRGLEATLVLAAVNCRVPLRDIYLDVQFGPEEEESPPAEPSV
jgi:Uma2 family endonuclease